MFGVSRGIVLPLIRVLLVTLVTSRGRIGASRLAAAFGVFLLCFLAVASFCRPETSAMVRQMREVSYDRPEFLYFVAAKVGAVFSPWMVAYQQAQVVREKRSAAHFGRLRAKLIIGAVITQSLTIAVMLVTTQAQSRHPSQGAPTELSQIAALFAEVVGGDWGRLAFGAGIVAASLVAALVCSLTLIPAGCHDDGAASSSAKIRTCSNWFAVPSAAVVLSLGLAWGSTNLVSLSVAAQVVSALSMPIVLFQLLSLCATELPDPLRARPGFLMLIYFGTAFVCVATLLGAICGVFE